MSDARRILLRLALAACERGDAAGARGLVAAALETSDAPEPIESATTAAESYAAFGRRVGASARTVRTMVRDGRIPRTALMGVGRGRRVLVEDALAALRGAVASFEELAGAAYVNRRSRLRAATNSRTAEEAMA